MKGWKLSGACLLLCGALVLAIFASVSVYAYSLAEARAYFQRHDWNGLLNYAKAWTGAEPNNPAAWESLSIAYYFGFHKPDQALAPTKRWTELAPKDAGAWTALGHVYVDLKRYPDAVNAYQQSVRLGPRDGNHWNNLAAAYADENSNCPMIYQTLQKQEQVAGPYQDSVLWYNLGNGFASVFISAEKIALVPAAHMAPCLSNPPQALRDAVYAFQQALRQNPRYAYAWNNLGRAEELLGANQNALSDYQRAASLGDPLGRKNYNDLQAAIAEEKSGGGFAGHCAPGMLRTGNACVDVAVAWGQAHY